MASGCEDVLRDRLCMMILQDFHGKSLVEQFTNATIPICEQTNIHIKPKNGRLSANALAGRRTRGQDDRERASMRNEVITELRFPTLLVISLCEAYIEGLHEVTNNHP